MSNLDTDGKDKENTNTIDYNEFEQIMSAKMVNIVEFFLKSQSERESSEEIEKAFLLFDRDKKGYITFENLKQIATELGKFL